MREASLPQLAACPLDEIRPVDGTDHPPWWLTTDHTQRAPRRQLWDGFIAQREAHGGDGCSDREAHSQAFEDFRARRYG